MIRPMAIAVIFLLGLGVGYAFALWRARRPDAGVQDEATATPAAVEQQREVATQRDFASLREVIANFGDTAAHPRMLRSLKEFNEAVAMFSTADTPLPLLLDYACGNDWVAGAVSYAALAEHPSGSTVRDSVTSRLSEAGNWPLYFALDYVARLSDRGPLGDVFVATDSHWVNSPMVLSFFVDHLQRRASLGDAAVFGESLSRCTPKQLDVTEALLRKVAHPLAESLLGELRRWRARTVNKELLATMGRLWSDEQAELLIEHQAIRESIELMEAALATTPPRSVLIVGEGRTGKTTVVRCVARRMMAAGYTFFEASGADLMSGQIYIGQLEGRIKQLLDEVSTEKRVIWVVPNLAQLATSGTHKGQTASILDQILPAVIAGRVALVSECSPKALVAMQQRWPVLRTAVEVLRMAPVDRPALESLARDYAVRLGQHLRLDVGADTSRLAIQLAAQYLGAIKPPGAVLDLMKLACNAAVAAGSSTVARDDVLSALSQVSGLPKAILDEHEKIDLAVVRDFFARRVIGQDAAVNAVVERIAMLKAGLTDPSRPVAVFLFAGPTGTGKTELAKSLAEFVFGSPERMIRLDMSEYQTYDGARKLIGQAEGSENESLVAKIVRQPFSVLLLDEFEKGHPGVWDLFLQVFDDGRLTDAQGVTADFRQSFIILTSNLGAVAHQSTGVGFAPKVERFASEQVMRAIDASFRPEFVNRLDRVVVFQPLRREDMRRILQKELKRTTERRGFRNREWAIEWEDSALEFLLERGFTASSGARPLKRAIEQFVIAPLAATIVEHRFPSGEQFLFVRGRNDAIEVEFVDPDADGTALVEDEATSTVARAPGSISAATARVALRPLGTVAERDLLVEAMACLRRSLDDPRLVELRDTLSRTMSARDFWDRSDRATVHSHYAFIDRIAAAARTAESLAERFLRGRSGRQNDYSRDLARRLASQILLVESGLQEALAGPPVEVLVSIEPILEAGPDARAAGYWREQIAQMYADWAKARRMQFVAVPATRGAASYLCVNGFGAQATLQREAGLHVLEPDVDGPESTSGRVAVRVSVATRALADAVALSDEAQFAAVFADRDRRSVVVRRYRVGGSPLVRDALGNWRTGRAHEVLQGNFDLFVLAGGE